MKEKRKVAILGAGYIAGFHIGALRTVATAELTAICDADPQRAAQAARQWGIAKVYTSAAELLDSGAADTVHILLPPAAHAAAARQCLQAGCDVFIEKPVTCSASDASGLAAIARSNGRSIGINHNNTCHPAFLQLLDAVREWRLGELQHVTACVNVPLRQLAAGQHSHWMFQAPGNIVLEQAPHPLSQIVKLLGPVKDSATLLSGRVTLNSGLPFYDTWQTSLECERGTAQLFMSFGREYFDFWVHGIGQDGAALADLRRNTFRASRKTRFADPVDNLLDAAGTARSAIGQSLANFSNYALGFLKLRAAADPFSSGMRMSIAQFYEDLAAGRPPREGIDQGIAVIDACERIMQAAGEAGVPRELAAEGVARG